MPSPFPGMDPYLEGEMWQEFHERLANQISMQLMPRLTPKYVALLAKRYVLSSLDLGIVDVPADRVFYPDLHLVETTPSPPVHGGGGGGTTVPAVRSGPAVADPTTELLAFLADEVPLLSIEIRDVAERRLVTIIEILSPVNKYGDGFREYMVRRSSLLQTQTHLLEIDLLRRGTRIALRGELPPAPYYVFLSRSQRRPATQVWAMGLRQPLPVVPVPLLAPDPDVPLDLQAAVDACFALVGYERLLDYTAPPPPPDLPATDADWVAERLRGEALER